MEYKVKFEDGPHPNYFVYAIEKDERKLYGCDVKLECRIEGQDIRTTIRREDIEALLPEHDWEMQVHEGLRNSGTNCIKVSKKEEIEKAVQAHKEAYLERFDWEIGRLYYHLNNMMKIDNEDELIPSNEEANEIKRGQEQRYQRELEIATKVGEALKATDDYRRECNR